VGPQLLRAFALALGGGILALGLGLGAFPLALGLGLLLFGKRLYPGGFLWLAFLPGFLHAPGAGWPLLWAKTSLGLLLLGLYLDRREGLWASFFLLPPALPLGAAGLGLFGAFHGLHLLALAGQRGFLSPLGALLPLLFGAMGLALAHLPWPALPLPALPRPTPLAPRPPGLPGEGGVVYAPPEGGFPPWVPLLDRALGYALPLALLLLLLTGALLLGRGRGPALRGVHLLPLLLALPALLGLFAFLGSLGGEGGAGGGSALGGLGGLEAGEPPRVEPGPRALGEAGVALAALSASLTLALLALLLLFAWRARGKEAGGEKEEKRGRGGIPQREALPQDRVRRAYALALKALKAEGLPRFPFEGPLAYQARVARTFPKAAPDLARLTGLYLPVRYGGVVGEECAGEAEEALKGILSVCSTSGSGKA
jgi:hypothetical protein